MRSKRYKSILEAKNEINIRTAVNLPSGTGKKIKIAVVCEDEKISNAKASGADIVGGDDLIEKIKSGDTNLPPLILLASTFQLLIAGKIL